MFEMVLMLDKPWTTERDFLICKAVADGANYAAAAKAFSISAERVRQIVTKAVRRSMSQGAWERRRLDPLAPQLHALVYPP